MKKIIDRLHEFIVYKGISLNAFDKSIGASNGYIGKQIKNSASIGGDLIEKISCIYVDLSVEWLITGKGGMFKNKEKDDISEHLVEDPVSRYMGPSDCQMCKMKDLLIDSLRQQIDTQKQLIGHLEEIDSPNEAGQKRKAAS